MTELRLVMPKILSLPVSSQIGDRCSSNVETEAGKDPENWGDAQ